MTLLKWVRATLIGWIAAVPVVAVLALAGEGLHIGGAHSLVGLGVGLSVGFAQGRLLRTLNLAWMPWAVATAIGLTLPFLGADILRVMGHGHRYALEMALAIGGATTGIAQAMLLRSRLPRPLPWVLVSILGWGAAALCALGAESLPGKGIVAGILGAALFLALIATGGLALGAVTGFVLVGSFQTEPISE